MTVNSRARMSRTNVGLLAFGQPDLAFLGREARQHLPGHHQPDAGVQEHDSGLPPEEQDAAEE